MINKYELNDLVIFFYFYCPIATQLCFCREVDLTKNTFLEIKITVFDRKSSILGRSK